MIRLLSCGVAVITLAAALRLSAAGEVEPESNRRNDAYYTETEAREKVFGDSLVWRDTVLGVDSLARARLYESTGLAEPDSTVRFSFALGPDSTLQAVYRVASEMGKHSPFDFLVGLNTSLEVEGIVVMTYREARGGDVRRSRFLKQFSGKTLHDPVSVNRDIVGIAGATLSSRAVARGVRKTLWWAHVLWPQGGEASE